MTSYSKVKQSDDDQDNRSNNKVKENINNEDNNNRINIKIKTTINEKILNFLINKDTNIHNIKQLIYNELTLKNDEYNIRLIFHGKLLSDDLKTLDNYNIQNNSYIHCIINKMNIATTPSNSTNTNSCRGFNILLTEDNLRIPLTIEEVNAIRSYFTSDVNEFM
jgi:hypothetical protein